MTKSGTGTWDLGLEDSGTPGHGTCTWGRGTRGLGRAGLEDIINKQHLIFSLNMLGTIFGALEKGIICREFVSRLEADDFQLPWFSLICLPAYFTVKTRAGT